MKAFLMYRDRDFDLEHAPPANEAVLTKDLELDTLFSAMAAKDSLVLEVAKKVILTSAANDVAVIEYRQAAGIDRIERCIRRVRRVQYALEVAVEQRRLHAADRQGRGECCRRFV